MNNQVKAFLIVVGKMLLAIVFAFILTIILTIPVIIAVIASGQLTLQEMTKSAALTGNPLFFYGSSIAQAIGFIIAVVLMRLIFERKSGWTLGWSRRNRLRFLMSGAVLGIVLMTLSFLGIWLSGGILVAANPFSGKLARDLLLSLLLFLFVALNEEIVTRGYVQGLIRHHAGAAAAIILSSIFFALLHGFNNAVFQTPIPMCNLLLAGILLALLREKSGGLWMPIGFHLTWNYFQGNVYGFAVSGMDIRSVLNSSPKSSILLSGGSFGAEGSLISLVLLLVCIIVVLRWKPANR